MKKLLFILALFVSVAAEAQLPVINTKPQIFLKWVNIRDSLRVKIVFIGSNDTAATQAYVRSLLGGGLSLAAGFGIKIVGDTIKIDSANYRKQDSMYVVNDSVFIIKINGNLTTYKMRGAVFSFNNRIGAVMPANGDYRQFYVQLDSLYSNPSWIQTLDFGKMVGLPTSLQGYGILNGVFNTGGGYGYGSGTFAQRPATPNFGSLYYASDSAAFYWGNGAAWIKLALSGGAGTITGPLTAGTIPYAQTSTKLGASPIINDTTNGRIRFNAPLFVSSTGASIFDAGNTAQRPGSPSAGMIRYNTDSAGYEQYNGAAWVKFAVGSGSGTSGTVTSIVFGRGLNGGTINASGNVSVDTTMIPRFADTLISIVTRTYLNTQGFLKVESDPIANAKNITLNQVTGGGVFVTGTSAQTLGSAPTWSVKVDSGVVATQTDLVRRSKNFGAPGWLTYTTAAGNLYTSPLQYDSTNGQVTSVRPFFFPVNSSVYDIGSNIGALKTSGIQYSGTAPGSGPFVTLTTTAVSTLGLHNYQGNVSTAAGAYSGYVFETANNDAYVKFKSIYSPSNNGYVVGERFIGGANRFAVGWGGGLGFGTPVYALQADSLGRLYLPIAPRNAAIDDSVLTWTIGGEIKKIGKTKIPLIHSNGTMWQVYSSANGDTLFDDGWKASADLWIRKGADSATFGILRANGVTPGSYTSANIIVDSTGRITGISNGSGGGSTYNFLQSVFQTGGNVTLLNDNSAPGNNYFYMTNPSGTKGWFPLSGLKTQLTIINGVIGSTDDSLIYAKLTLDTGVLIRQRFTNAGGILIDKIGSSQDLNRYNFQFDTGYAAFQAYVSAHNAVTTTIAAIRALTAVSASQLYFTSDINRQGQWYYDASDNTSADNTGTVLVTAGGQRLKRIYSGWLSVLWFPVKGDSTTDCAAGIEAATVAAAGNTLYWPSGKYFVSRTVVIPGMNNTSWVGQDTTSLIVFNAGYNTLKFTGPLRNVKFQNIFFKTGYTNAVEDGSGVFFVDHVDMLHVYIVNCRFSAPLANTSGITLSINIGDTTVQHRATDVNIIHNEFINIGRIACNIFSRVWDSTRCREFRFNENRGINLGSSGSYGMLITADGQGINGEFNNNYMIDCLSSGIEVNGFSHSTISGNRFDYGVRAYIPINLDGPQPKYDLTVSNNVSTSSLQTYVNFFNVRDSKFSNNTWYGLGGSNTGVVYMGACKGNKFVNDQYIALRTALSAVTFTTGQWANITNTGNTWINCTFKATQGHSSYPLIRFDSTGTAGNTISNCTFIKANDSSYIAQTAGATANRIWENDHDGTLTNYTNITLYNVSGASPDSLKHKLVDTSNLVAKNNAALIYDSVAQKWKLQNTQTIDTAGASGLNGAFVQWDASLQHFKLTSNSGIGTVTQVTAPSGLSGFMTSSVATNTTTPVITWAFVNTPGADKIWGKVGAAGTPGYFTPSLTSTLFQNQGTTITVLHGNPAGLLSFGAVNMQTDMTGTMQANQFPALNGDVSTTAGSLTTAIGAGKVTNVMLAGSIDASSKITNILPGTNGGTGVNNNGKTITLGGNFTTSGAFASVFTMTGNTSVTFPTSGTLLNSTSNGGSLTGITWSVQGTANQVLINGSTAAQTGASVFSLPQSIAPGSSPTFTAETLTGLPTFGATDGIVTISSGGVLGKAPNSALGQSGFYTPTAYGPTNCTVNTTNAIQYIRVGKEVHISGNVNITASAGAVWSFKMPLPYATTAAPGVGSGTYLAPNGTYYPTAVQGTVDAGAGIAIVNGNNNGSGTAFDVFFSFIYITD